MDGKARRANINGAFYLKDPSEVSGRRILVVDDVMTTGATVNECAKTLKKGGAKEVHVLTLARTCIG
jgi:predicted amidophosphoribosyltransferase